MNIWRLWETISEVNDMYYGIDEPEDEEFDEVVGINEEDEEIISNHWSIHKDKTIK